ncbi:DUF2470 domain-containing protein [Helicobacter mehlei]|uniref:DUF2470 domain-containing protein n=1 Tax=Helicobacter mehlei TaxID=2316080 RepID=A0A553V1F3_9HELI|nr:DUF2470 domain-containing protein [Helicobacter mehlei]TSA86309.1 DUF2470 domain-containing protein [Helicobacter mehlei]
MDKQHALDILNSKQLDNVLKLFEKYASVQWASNVHVQDISLSEMEIAYTKEGKQEVFRLAFPYPLDSFEGIRDALIALLGPDASNVSDSYQSCHTENQHQQNHFGSGAQGSFGPQGNPGNWGHQGYFGPQAGGFAGQHPFNTSCGFNGSYGPWGMPFGFTPFPYFGMFVMGFVPFGFHPMPQHFNPQAHFGPQSGFHPDMRTPHQGQQDFSKNQGPNR